jgi:dynamin 1-like protein
MSIVFLVTNRLTSGIVKDYISQESTIILAVAPANDDIGNALSLKLAREVDPKGERTLGVLTKIDIMDKGVSCIDILKNKAYPLKHGFIGVKGRNQEDILANISVKQGL